MDQNANVEVDNLQSKDEDGEIKKADIDKHTSLIEQCAKTSVDEWEHWSSLDTLKIKSENTYALIMSTYRMAYRFQKPSRELWIKITDEKFRRYNMDTTWPINELVDKLENMFAKNLSDPDRQKMLFDCLKPLIHIRVIWQVKFKILDFLPDGLNVKLYFLMVARMRVRVFKMKIFTPKCEDSTLSCILVVQQILDHMVSLCVELQNMVTSHYFFKEPLDDVQEPSSEDLYVSDDEDTNHADVDGGHEQE